MEGSSSRFSPVLILSFPSLPPPVSYVLFTPIHISTSLCLISSISFFSILSSLSLSPSLFFSRSVRLSRYTLSLSLHLFLFLLSLSVLSPRQPRLSSGFSIKCLRTCHLSGFVLSCFLFALEKYTYVRMVIGRRVTFFLVKMGQSKRGGHNYIGVDFSSPRSSRPPPH